MLRLEEYITKRKKEDQMNEFDIKSKDDNMQKSINYVFEYFSNYLDLENYNEEMYSQNLKVRGYEKQLTDYEPPVKEYLLWYYKVYGKRLKRPFEEFLKKDPNFLLKSGEAHFRDSSYEMYAKFNKKYDGIKTNYDYSSIKNPFGVNDVYSKFGSLPYIKGNKKLLLSLIRVGLVGDYDEVDLKLVEKWQKDINNL